MYIRDMLIPHLRYLRKTRESINTVFSVVLRQTQHSIIVENTNIRQIQMLRIIICATFLKYSRLYQVVSRLPKGQFCKATYD